MKAKDGLIVGPEYEKWVKSKLRTEEVKYDKVSSILRMTLVTDLPLTLDHDGLATFLIPPGSPGFDNTHPIRVYQ